MLRNRLTFVSNSRETTVVQFSPSASTPYSSGVGRLVELQVSGEDLALRLALRSVDAGSAFSAY
jgi:hypothetical protein